MKNRTPWIVIIAGFLGAFLSRWHGGGFFKAEKWIKNILWTLPGVVLSWALGGPWYALVSVFNILKSTGNGGGADLGTNPKEPGTGRGIEKPEYLIYPWLYKLLPRYWYDMVLCSITGLASVLGTTLVFGYHDPVAGLLQAAGGLMKGPSYAIGWALFPNPADPKNTQTGETLSGLFAYTFMFLAYFKAAP